MNTNRIYDLEERTFKFSLRVKSFCKDLKLDSIDRIYVMQLIRSAGSVAANYIEANENLGKKDLKMRIRICKKEAKESRLWLLHLNTENEIDTEEKQFLIQETTELQKIFGAILKKLDATPEP